MNEISQVIAPGEKMAYEGKPKYAPYLISVIVGIVIAAAVIGAIIGAVSDSMTIGILIGIIILGLGIFLVNLAYSRTHYAITDKRVIIQTGIVGRDFKSIDYERMQNVSASVGLIGVIFKVGTVKIFTGEMQTTGGRNARMQPKYDKLRYISNPYEVLKTIQTNLAAGKK
ncbi:MAG: PH domain-containing protein [bacterium]|nr:PH domain-containing protein [bacterium]